MTASITLRVDYLIVLFLCFFSPLEFSIEIILGKYFTVLKTAYFEPLSEVAVLHHRAAVRHFKFPLSVHHRDLQAKIGMPAYQARGRGARDMTVSGISYALFEIFQSLTRLNIVTYPLLLVKPFCKKDCRRGLQKGLSAGAFQFRLFARSLTIPSKFRTSRVYSVCI